MIELIILTIKMIFIFIFALPVGAVGLAVEIVELILLCCCEVIVTLAESWVNFVFRLMKL